MVSSSLTSTTSPATVAGMLPDFSHELIKMAVTGSESVWGTPPSMLLHCVICYKISYLIWALGFFYTCTLSPSFASLAVCISCSRPHQSLHSGKSTTTSCPSICLTTPTLLAVISWRSIMAWPALRLSQTLSPIYSEQCWFQILALNRGSPPI